ncbi:MAG: NAD(P)-dependent oxidoreductase [bacterium]
MKKRKVLFIDPVHPMLARELEKSGYQCDQFPEYGRDELIRIIDEYTGIIIRSKIRLDQEFLEHADKLRFIGRAGSGMENIDVDYAIRRGIACLNAPEGNRDAVGEQAIGMILSLFNHMKKADTEVRNGSWLREENRGTELNGKTIGIIGYGNTGSAFAKKLCGFDVEVLAYDKYKRNYGDPHISECDMPTLFDHCDIVSLHVPLTDETRYLVDEDFISSFKKNFYLVNTSRGKVVRTSDLVRGLQSAKILGACLDVLEYEGLSYEQLQADVLAAEDFRLLAAMENVILSPHVAGWTHESHYKIAMTLLGKIRDLRLD